MKQIFYCGLIFAMGCNSAQNKSADPEKLTEATEEQRISFANTITEEELKEHLYTYASDEFKGRETGTESEKTATAYLKKNYEEMGIPAAKGGDNYFQNVPIEQTEIPTGSITIDGKTYTIGSEIITYSSLKGNDLEIAYAGYGIDSPDYSDYNELDVNGKIVLIKLGEPISADGTYLLSGSKEPSDWSNWRETLSKRVQIAKEKGAAGVLYSDDQYFGRTKQRFDYYKSSGHSGQMRLKSDDNPIAVMFINSETAASIYPEFATAESGSVLATKAQIDIDNHAKEVTANNVVALIKGKTKPDEYVVVSAHLDHVGVDANGNVFNGADDDGSGTVAVLEIAEAFKKAADAGYGPDRSIIFLHVTGEEKGLFGSEYYTDHPIFPLANTVADLNIDMIGRIDPDRTGDRNYIYLIGSDKLSTELHNLSEEVNKKYANIQLDYKYNDKNDPNRFYYRSDHYNFAKNNIPVIFYFNGTHADYHKISDTPDKINYDLLTNRARLVFQTAWEVANRPERIIVDKAEATE
ncbi:M28 family peptidase [Robertkochia solimangrovi]|uniref:M28 family peptidase n=1 Tax=Robertkochia solimangrovi TaxID=2213046 RepID=UPI00118075F2|nr:M28 family peptidase [Robertkochia solimangrovi]TRZ42311.1 peptidase [Robertkochia solimangrovi]